MILFIVSIVVIVVWSVAAHLLFPNKISTKEMLVKASITSVVGGIFLACVYYKDMYDNAIVNGSVTGKEQQTVSCSHSYQCNCYQSCSGTGAQRTCTTTCSTCYEHSVDYDWNVYTTVGTMEISRIDRQGVNTPPRWREVKIGEPASNSDTYLNYVMASPSSLFSMKEKESDLTKWAGMIPEYPRIYDYYRYNRIIQVKASYSKAQELNSFLNNELRVLGGTKQVNIITVFVGTNLPEYRYALERAWLGGKKNDVIVIMGMEAGQLTWVDTITFGKNSGNEMLAVQLRDRIKDVAKNGRFDDPLILGTTITSSIKEYFHRKEMKDYEYLKDEYTPSMAALLGFVIFQLIILTGMTLYFYNNDPFDSYTHNRSTLTRSDYYKIFKRK